jgi:hypothetical protein
MKKTTNKPPLYRLSETTPDHRREYKKEIPEHLKMSTYLCGIDPVFTADGIPASVTIYIKHPDGTVTVK